MWHQASSEQRPEELSWELHETRAVIGSWQGQPPGWLIGEGQVVASVVLRRDSVEQLGRARRRVVCSAIEPDRNMAAAGVRAYRTKHGLPKWSQQRCGLGAKS